MTIELVPLMTATINLREPIMLPNTPSGTRLIIEVASATFEGDRIRGKQKGVAAADWLTVGPEGTGTLDVRATLETDDGALIYSCYRGRLDVSQPVRQRADLRRAPLRDRRRALRVDQQDPGRGQGHDRRAAPRVRDLRVALILGALTA